MEGYPDGSFRPGQYITRGQMACFLVRALGTLVHETGDQIAGGVYGKPCSGVAAYLFLSPF